MRKSIKGYEGIYEVDEFGNVYSLNRFTLRETTFRNGKSGVQKINHKGKQLKNYIAKNGYEVVNLCNHLGNKQHYVHFLVAQAFLGDRPNRYTINHKDGCKTNNNIENLEYVTYAENNEHAKRLGLNNCNIGDYSLKIGVVQICRKTNKEIAAYESAAEAERILNTSHIACAAKGKRKTAGGYKWKQI
jgi:hypothetical protein